MMMTALWHRASEGVRSLFRQRGKAPDTTPQGDITLPRYLGRWYEQARYECFFERGMDEVSTDYTARADGGIDITNRGTTAGGRHKEAHGRAVLPDEGNRGRLLVSFVPPYRFFRAPYHILYVDESYSMALVSGQGEGYLWLLTRARKADDAAMRRLLDEAQKRGFDLGALRLTRQAADDARGDDAPDSAQKRKSAPNET